jgi:hypothetical protein
MCLVGKDYITLAKTGIAILIPLNSLHAMTDLTQFRIRYPNI